MISITAKEDEVVKIDETITSSFHNLKGIIRSKEKSPEILGFHFEVENAEIILKSSYYIGYVWLIKNKFYINVIPKTTNNGRVADFVEMFSNCINNSYVANNLSATYKIFTEQPQIEIDKNEDFITPFIIVNFIKVLQKITQRGLKKGYINEIKNLSSKVKGKILVNSTIKTNHFQNKGGISIWRIIIKYVGLVTAHLLEYNRNSIMQ